MAIERDCRILSDLWAKKSFAEAATSQFPRYSPESVQLFENLLAHTELQAIAAAPMIGTSLQALPRGQEGATFRVRFTEAFHNVVKVETFDPALYMLELVDMVRKQYDEPIRLPKLEGFIARALRSFASLMRESTFAHELRPMLKGADADVEFRSDPDQDSKDHTDILVVFRRSTYRIWVYQFSDNGLPHDMERLAGLRGALPAGTHILCPLKSEPARTKAEVIGLIERSEAQVAGWRTDHSRSKSAARSAKLAEQIARGEDRLTKLRLRLADAEREIDGSIDERNGFYFYSTAFVRSVADKIITGAAPQPYDAVRRMMLAPREYLGGINAFEIK
ncbi:MAG: hypothetical protein ACK5C3_09145 [bacterium]|jgi:hypothetical protein